MEIFSQASLWTNILFITILIISCYSGFKKGIFVAMIRYFIFFGILWVAIALGEALANNNVPFIGILPPNSIFFLVYASLSIFLNSLAGIIIRITSSAFSADDEHLLLRSIGCLFGLGKGLGVIFWIATLIFMGSQMTGKSYAINQSFVAKKILSTGLIIIKHFDKSQAANANQIRFTDNLTQVVGDI